MNKQSITFSASEQTLEKTGGIDNYASNIVSYVEATFTLGENWTGYDVVRAVWESAYAKISTVLDSDHKCVVPAEVLRHKSKVNVNLVGSIVTNDVLTDRLTTYPVHAITVDADARVDSTETQPITPSQFEQFVEAVHADAESIQDYSYDSEAWAKGTRGGVAVPSTDPTYHNNSKYYADQGAELEQEVSDLKSDFAYLEKDGVLPKDLAFEIGGIDESTGEPSGDSAYKARTIDFLDAANAAKFIFYKSGVSIYIFRYDKSDGSYIGNWYYNTSYDNQLFKLNISPFEKFKIQLLSATPASNVGEITSKAKIYVSSSNVIQRKEFDEMMYIPQDMTNYESAGWIRASDGQYYASSSTKMYKYKNLGYSKAKIIGKMSSNTIAVAAFYSSETITPANFISAVAYESENRWITQVVDIPSNCDTIAISVSNADSDGSPLIMLSADGVVKSIFESFAEEGTDWEE